MMPGARVTVVLLRRLLSVRAQTQKRLRGRRAQRMAAFSGIPAVHLRFTDDRYGQVAAVHLDPKNLLHLEKPVPIPI